MTNYDDIRDNTIAQQQAKLDTYNVLTARGLPIPRDLKAEIEANDNQQDGKEDER